MTKIGGVELVPGYMYRIRTKTSAQKYEREHCLTYLGDNRNKTLSFNARPFAGTQELRPDEIVKLEPVRPGAGRENPAHYMNRIVR